MMTDQRNESVAQSLELGFGGGVEERQGVQVDGVVRVLAVDDDSSASVGRGTASGNTDIAEQILGVLQIRFFLGTSKTRSALGLGLVVELVSLGESGGTLSLEFGDSLGLGLFVGSSLGLGLGLCFGSLLFLLTLDFGVFGGIPVVKDLST